MEEHFMKKNSRYESILLSFLRANPAKTIVEVGIGNGEVTSLVPSSRKIVGFEIAATQYSANNLLLLGAFHESMLPAEDIIFIGNPPYELLPELLAAISKRRSNFLLLSSNKKLILFPEFSQVKLTLQGDDFNPPAQGSHHLVMGMWSDV